MGAGASADSTKGKKGSKGSVAVAPKAAKVSDSGAAALAKAVKDDAAAKLIFNEVDSDKNGKVSLDELKAAISKKAVPTWRRRGQTTSSSVRSGSLTVMGTASSMRANSCA